MADTPIIQRIVIQGGKEVEAAFSGIGKAGEEAFQRIERAQEKAASKGAAKNFDTINKTLNTTGAAAQTASTKVQRLAGLFDVLGATSKEATANAKKFSKSQRDAAVGLGRISDDSDQASASMSATDISAIRLGQSLRLIGRAAGLTKLSQFGRGLGVLGRAFEIASPVILVAGLGFLATAATTAAEKIQQLAAENLVTAESFQEVNSAFANVGRNVDDTGKAFSGLNSMIAKAADNTKSNENNFRRMGEEITEARNKGADLAREFSNIGRESARAFRDFQQSTSKLGRDQLESAKEFEQALEKIARARKDLVSEPSAGEKKRRQVEDLDTQEEKLRDDQAKKSRQRSQDLEKANEALADSIRKTASETRKLIEEQSAQDKKIRDTQRAMQEAREEAERNMTALERLGIRATEANGRLRTVPGILEDIAGKLSKVTDVSKRERIENELVAAGLDRKLIPVLRRGTDAYKAFIEEGKRVQPVFTPDQFKAADDFQIAMGRASNALFSVRDALGLAIAPAFTEAFDRLTELFIELRPAAEEFGKVFGTVLKQAMIGLITVITELGKAIGTVFSTIASTINATFGTKVTGVEVFVAAILGLMVVLGGLPIAIIAATAAVGVLLDKINKSDFSPFTKNLLKIAVIAGIAFIALGPIILTFVGGLIKAGIVVGRVFGAGIKTVTTFGTILGRIGIVVGKALGSIGGVIVRIIGYFTSLGGTIVRAFLVALPYITSFLTTLVGWVGVIVRVVGAIASFVAGLISLPVAIGIVVAAAVGFFAVWAYQNWAKITQFAADAWEKIKSTASALWEFTKKLFSTSLEAIGKFFTETVPQAATDLWNWIKDGALAMWTSITGFFTSGFDKLKGYYDRFKNFAVGVWERITAAAQESAAAQEQAAPGNEGGAPPIGRARGGPVWGAGTGTSDSIPAMLSAGEFVHSAKAVRHYGSAFMSAINNLRVPKGMVPRFNMGGLVDAMSMPMGRVPLKFAEGGQVPAGGGGMHPVTIDLGNGQSITGLRAPRSVVKQLEREATRRAAASAGRKPTSYGAAK